MYIYNIYIKDVRCQLLLSSISKYGLTINVFTSTIAIASQGEIVGAIPPTLAISNLNYQCSQINGLLILLSSLHSYCRYVVLLQVFNLSSFPSISYKKVSQKLKTFYVCVLFFMVGFFFCFIYFLKFRRHCILHNYNVYCLLNQLQRV